MHLPDFIYNTCFKSDFSIYNILFYIYIEVKYFEMGHLYIYVNERLTNRLKNTLNTIVYVKIFCYES